MQHIGLFEGIGGFSIATNRKGYTTAAWCEWDAECQKILSYYHPDADKYGDIRQGDFTKYRGKTHLLTGGFPCQPFSAAGKRKGTEDDRYLWPEMLRVIDEVRPAWVIGENVYGLISWDNGAVFDTVCEDLKAIGYEVCPVVIPASGVGAPHRRDRVWFIARNITDTHGLKFPEPTYAPVNVWSNFPAQWPVVNEGDGQVGPLDGISFPKWRKLSIKGYGNAICPQVAEMIIDVIHEFESLDYATIPEMLMARDVWNNDRCSLEWRLKKSKSGRPFYMLQTSKSKLIPSPRTSDCNHPGIHGTGGQDLRTVIAMEVGMLPTPQAIDGTGDGRELRLKKDMPRDPTALGSYRGDLKDWAFSEMLPTPAASDHAHRRKSERWGGSDLVSTIGEKISQINEIQAFPVVGVKIRCKVCGTEHVSTEAEYETKVCPECNRITESTVSFIYAEMLPTPTAQDYRRRDPNSKQQGLPEQMHAKHGEKGKTAHLNPAFVAEMMGFPVDYTYLPFAEL